MVIETNPKLYQSFYTKSTPIVQYMVNKLQLEEDDKIFEPCGGDGEFINPILQDNKHALIDVFELNPSAVEVLNAKFGTFESVKINLGDTLLDERLIICSRQGGEYDKIIANPPYGGWQNDDKKLILKRVFPKLYVKETYGLFLYRCIELLKQDGILTFIIPDTFLNLHMHKALRNKILSKTKIIELALFPSSFFPGVNFGYANLSIITLKKSNSVDDCLVNEFDVLMNFEDVNQLSVGNQDKLTRLRFSQLEIMSNPDFAFLISDNPKIAKAINTIETKIGDIAKCVTGFYSGDDKRFLRVLNKEIKNSKNYETVSANCIAQVTGNEPNILDGLEGPEECIPIVKGGNIKYLKPETWFMTWTKEAVQHFKKDKRARFQNPRFYFQYGIGVPMISSSSITASLINHSLFDQSIVGIFPDDTKLVYYILAFFNSPTCNILIRTINPSANNPSNYIKKIPFIYPSKEELEAVNQKVEQILSSIKSTAGYDKRTEHQIHSIFHKQYGF